MHWVSLILAAALLVLFPPWVQGFIITDPSQLAPGWALIDFESFDTQGNLETLLPNPVTFGNVTFTSLTGTPLIFDMSLSGNWSQNLAEVSGKTLFPGAEPDSAITIQFAHPVSEVLLGWGDPNYSGNMLLAYDASGNLLDQAAVELGPAGGVHAAWIGFRQSQPEIAKIIVQPDQSHIGGDDYVIDNIYYKPRGPATPVPEPSTLLLLGSGLAGLGGMAWRRHRRD